ncbi:hypothetical protein BDY21DRAFT_113082 [Lineolata rhizophorae]|uniref:Uncharacterized protein n=1 Tax=Lineolata rhizophorae TaxID=578093 RepID=A0A6A6NRU4_9PEZI|nr:hypothetical protein BDY21DRAFT_113082 [Lineolata rhizophorae]
MRCVRRYLRSFLGSVTSISERTASRISHPCIGHQSKPEPFRPKSSMGQQSTTTLCTNLEIYQSG